VKIPQNWGIEEAVLPEFDRRKMMKARKEGKGRGGKEGRKSQKLVKILIRVCVWES
jgi:hypothetical protein